MITATWSSSRSWPTYVSSPWSGFSPISPVTDVLVAGLRQLLALGVGLLVQLGGVLPALVCRPLIAHRRPPSWCAVRPGGTRHTTVDAGHRDLMPPKDAAVAATDRWTDPDGFRAPAGLVHAWLRGTNQTLCGVPAEQGAAAPVPARAVGRRPARDRPRRRPGAARSATGAPPGWARSATASRWRADQPSAVTTPGAGVVSAGGHQPLSALEPGRRGRREPLADPRRARGTRGGRPGSGRG